MWKEAFESILKDNIWFLVLACISTNESNYLDYISQVNFTLFFI